MTDLQASKRTSGPIPIWVLIPAAIVVIGLFIALLFPWDAVARRLAFEIGAASGARVSLDDLSPAWTKRGPVLRASSVVIEHPSVQRLRVSTMEVAPRFGASWLKGEPRLRVFADSELGVVDGVLVLGRAPAFDGKVKRVAIERLPLRLAAAGMKVAGELGAKADVALDPGGTLRGRVEFDSPSLRFESGLIPRPLVFSRASGSLSILENGATRIEQLALEGDQVRGTLSGEIGLVHRSQPPPLDLQADLEIVDPQLRTLASAAGLPVGPDGRASVSIQGTAALPLITPRGGALPPPPSPRADARRIPGGGAGPAPEVTPGFARGPSALPGSEGPPPPGGPGPSGRP